jgi:hypothetical protein
MLSDLDIEGLQDIQERCRDLERHLGDDDSYEIYTWMFDRELLFSSIIQERANGKQMMERPKVNRGFMVTLGIACPLIRRT